MALTRLIQKRNRKAAPAQRPTEPFDASKVMRRLRQTVASCPKAAMFELAAADGYTSVFQQLVTCMISIRTFEEQTLVNARRLFARAARPREIAKLGVDEIDHLIRSSTFHRGKAAQILNIAKLALTHFGGELPADREALIMLPGVGPKCANLAIGVATGRPVGIPVDIHVHRVSNRWGIVTGRSREETMQQLERALPRRYWLEINKLLVPFGRTICRAPRPKCSHCPLASMCRKVGVELIDPAPPAANCVRIRSVEAVALH